MRIKRYGERRETRSSARDLGGPPLQLWDRSDRRPADRMPKKELNGFDASVGGGFCHFRTCGLLRFAGRGTGASDTDARSGGNGAGGDTGSACESDVYRWRIRRPDAYHPRAVRVGADRGRRFSISNPELAAAIGRGRRRKCQRERRAERVPPETEFRRDVRV